MKGTNQMTLDHVLKMDANIIDALLLATLQDRDKYMQLVKRQGQEAQSLLDLLQAVRSYCCPFILSYSDITQRLGFPLDASLKRLHTGALIKLSRYSVLYPECLTLTGIQLVGDAPIDVGNYGDIWKGLLSGQVIAVKMLRIYRTVDQDKLLKVVCLF